MEFLKFFTCSFDHISTVFLGFREYEWRIDYIKNNQAWIKNLSTGHSIKIFRPFLFEINTQTRTFCFSGIFLCGNACGFLPHFVYRLKPILEAQRLIP